VFVWNHLLEDASGMPRLLAQLAGDLWEADAKEQPQPLFHSLWANFNALKGNTILGRQWLRLHGPEYAWQVCTPIEQLILVA
jgi:hypothetical protein